MKFENILIFAFLGEIQHQKNAYCLNKATEKDTIQRSFQKLKNCINYDIKTVKWRRIFIPTIFSTFLVYIFALKRFPTAKEFILSASVIFIPFYFSYTNYSETTSKEAMKYSLDNIKNIKTIIKNKKKLII